MDERAAHFRYFRNFRAERKSESLPEYRMWVSRRREGERRRKSTARTL